MSQRDRHDRFQEICTSALTDGMVRTTLVLTSRSGRASHPATLTGSDPMTPADAALKAALESQYGDDWVIGRTYKGGDRRKPNWWTATRRRQLSDTEINRGLSQTLVHDTEPSLRQELAVQAEKQKRMAVR